jgi:hypothetical protein
MAGSVGPRADLDAVKNKYFFTRRASRLQHTSTVIYSFRNKYYLPEEQSVFQSFLLLKGEVILLLLNNFYSPYNKP